MCGGAGTRLWPASREVRPKQFLPLFGKRSTFQETLLRVSDAALFERPIVITNAAYRFMVLEQLAEIGLEADILLEPVRRDSGPAIAAGAAFAQTRGSDAVVLALAADHVVRDNAAFVAACREGLVGRQSRQHRHLRRQAGARGDRIRLHQAGQGDCRRGPRGREIRREAGYRDRRRVHQVGLSLEQRQLHVPRRRPARRVPQGRCRQRGDVSEAVAKAGRDLGFVTLDPQSFGKARAISIDYAVMEKTSRAAVVPVSCGWSDVGSWHAVWELSDKDAQGNAAQGAAVFEDSRNCNVSTDRALVALEGVDDLVVVATQDAVLVSRQKDANGLKRLVAKLKTVAPQVTEDHIRVHRPWGSYQSVDNGDRHQVKRIIVKPGGRLSLQKHHHRAEHWIVVRGTAQVTVNELRQDRARERVDLYSDRRGAPAGKSRQDPARADRGADRQLFRRGRHHPHRGRLSAVIILASVGFESSQSFCSDSPSLKAVN